MGIVDRAMCLTITAEMRDALAVRAAKEHSSLDQVADQTARLGVERLEQLASGHASLTDRSLALAATRYLLLFNTALYRDRIAQHRQVQAEMKQTIAALQGPLRQAEDGH